MAKVPYGVSVHNPNEADEAWTKLATINEHLEAGESIPPDLARWLGGAIEYSGRDPDEFLRRLGVKRGRGAAKRNPDAWRVYGRRVCELEDEGMKAEAALAQVLTETDEMFSRSRLQNLRDEYRATRDAALNPE